MQISCLRCYVLFANYLSIKLWKHPCRMLGVYFSYLQFVLHLGWWLYPWGMSQCQSGHTSGYHPEQWIHCCHRARRRNQNILLKGFVILKYCYVKKFYTQIAFLIKYFKILFIAFHPANIFFHIGMLSPSKLAFMQFAWWKLSITSDI